MEFKEFGLAKPILDALSDIGYEKPTEIQAKAIPKIMLNKDVIGMAQTGTGKTAAFALPLIDRIAKQKIEERYIKVLILSPTRELAIQIRDNVRAYSNNVKLKSSVILGGVNQVSQIKVLKNGVDILVATPGRLLDLINQKKVDLSRVSTVVLDEADTMVDMGFIKDVTSIVNRTPKVRQTLMFSATLSNDVKKLSQKFMHNPLIIKTVAELTADKVRQEVYFVEKHNKLDLLLEKIDTIDKPTTLIFTRTKHGANKLKDKLTEYGIKTSVIHGNKSQSNRVKALSDFKTGKTRIMIATDIAARGIDINDLNLVVNYEMPEKPEIYVHRIGRTARAGKEGVAISFCSTLELKLLKQVEKIIEKKIPVVEHKYKSEGVVIPKDNTNPRTKKYNRNYDSKKAHERNNFDSKFSKQRNYNTSAANKTNKPYKKKTNRKKK